MVSLRTVTKSPIARKIRRHRRPIAAVLAACSVLMIIAALQPAPPVVTIENPRLLAGEVGAPVTLSSASIAAAVQPGDVVDVLALDGEPPAATPVVVASRVRVVEVRESALLILAVTAEQALDLAGVAYGLPLTITMYPRGASQPVDESIQ
jgi:hypothetical protein